MDEYKRPYFVFLRSHYDVVMKLKNESYRNVLLNAICKYAFLHEDTAIGDENLALIWDLMKPPLDAGWRGVENGLNGGAPKGNKNALKQPKNNQKTTKKQPIREKIEDKRKKIEDKRVCNNTPAPVIIQSVDDFSYSLEDCRLLFNEVGCFDETVIQNCFDYYNMRGWKTQNGVKITSLKSCVSNWLKMEIDRNTSTQERQRQTRIKELASATTDLIQNSIESREHEVKKKEPPF